MKKNIMKFLKEESKASMFFVSCILSIFLAALVPDDCSNLFSSIGLLCYFGAMWILFRKNMIKESLKGFIILYSFTGLIILFTSGWSIILINNIFNTEYNFSFFVFIYSLQQALFFLILHLVAIKKHKDKKWNNVLQRINKKRDKKERDKEEQSGKLEIEIFLNRIKTASGYAVIVFNIPMVVINSWELSSFGHLDLTYYKSLFSIFVISITILGLFRAFIDHMIYSLKFSPKFKY